MTLFGLYSKPENGPEAIEAVSEKFRWTAFFFSPLWALSKGLWLYLALWLAIAAALGMGQQFMGADAAVALYGLFALWTGFAAGAIEGRALKARGWIDHGDIAAFDRTQAENLWLKKHYGARP
ncbi:DUF2628 domain-containing protein [Pelagibacterium lentulum]|uniref:DUF2628 domain-containing protein n=1 Tax=Pelagibacterium lentulum TaxID=2029865 RepID=A0A916R6B6_9HYPH|nr:DUF2628 domain-containing protein [Pelagibacterium lentulum]GGA37513.1 hypothetical protein GCM10011499_03590 [Pelagibacterium lentulum]